MTEATGKFLLWAEGYYGEYRDTVRAEVAKRLDGEVENRGALYLEALRQELLNGYSNRFRVPPDVATINEFSRAARDRWHEMKPPVKLLPVTEYMDREELGKAIGEMLEKLAKKHSVRRMEGGNT